MEPDQGVAEEYFPHPAQPPPAQQQGRKKEPSSGSASRTSLFGAASRTPFQMPLYRLSTCQNSKKFRPGSSYMRFAPQGEIAIDVPQLCPTTRGREPEQDSSLHHRLQSPGVPAQCFPSPARAPP